MRLQRLSFSSQEVKVRSLKTPSTIWRSDTSNRRYFVGSTVQMKSMLTSNENVSDAGM